MNKSVSSSRDLLILKYEGLNEEAAHFFKEMNNDESVREVFFRNPGLVLRSKLPSMQSISLTDQDDDAANRLIFSVFSNDKFRGFLEEFQERKKRALERLLKSPDDAQAMKALDERTIRLEIAEALIEYGDRELLSNLFPGRGPGGGAAVGWWLVVVAVLIVVVAAAVHAVLALGTSGDLMATAMTRPPIPASEIRKIADQLVAAAKEARDAGHLS